MKNFNNIQSKLQQFIKKYYTNELIKGIILFFSFGLLYFIFTLLIEYFLWLKPTARTILFWLFIIVEVALLVKFILIPIFKLVGIQKGISLKNASKIIGNHFKEVDDKLLNILQLNETTNQSELLIASIDQKAANLQPIPFKKAIDFTTNKKYLKYLAIPIFIWLITYFTGNKTVFSESFNRVKNYEVSYNPPAPFTFYVLNDTLTVIEGKQFKLTIETRGNIVPSDAKIHFLNQNNYLKNNGLGSFEYNFSSITTNLKFYFEANGISSKEYEIKVIPAPTITGLSMFLKYPSYTKKANETIKNTGNALIPQGTVITWNINTKNANQVSFLTSEKSLFTEKTSTKFQFVKRINDNLDYQIVTSNKNLKDFESLSFAIQVIKDQFPKISVKSDLDSVTRGPIQFAGQLSDDYGLTSLQLVYYDINNKSNFKKHPIKIKNSSFEEFYYVFPEGINLQEGINYEMYFEVADNDFVNGTKTTKSNPFSYYKKSKKELENQILEEQKNTISDLQKSIDKSKEVKLDFQKLQQSLQNKSEMNWNDQKKASNFMQRQKEYQQMMQRQTEKLQKNLSEQPKTKNKSLEERKKDIQERLKEAKELAKQEKLLDELKKLAEKMQKEELTSKLKELTEKNKQNEKSLERILELAKRFYVEQKATQIKEKLDDLAKKQEDLANSKDNNSEKQKELNKEFDNIKKELNQLNKDNKNLKHPMDIPKMVQDKKSVEEDQEEATQDLENSEQESDENESNNSKSKASKSQKSASKKMKKMSDKMQSSLDSMSGGGEGMEEDIEALRAILENLLAFSFQQEDLINVFSEINNSHPVFSSSLKKQQLLREYFEHIDDSLYTLSLRQPKISSQIFKDLGNVHYHLDESLVHFSDNQFNTGLSDQQFVMTSTNDLAYLLSNILNAMQNAMPSQGNGKGKGKGKGNSFSLSDIIQKQGEMLGKMKQGVKKGQNPNGKGKEKGKNGKQGQSGQDGDGEQMNGELYEIYKQQAKMRAALEDLLSKNKGKGAGKNAEKVLKEMEELEQELLEKGFTNEVLQKMMNLKNDLLKLEDAKEEQGQKEERESTTNTKLFENKPINQLQLKKLRFNQNEILNRQSLPLRAIYKKKVQQYFKINDTIQ